MIRAAISVACCLTILSYSTIAASSLVSSTFDSDADGWSGLTTDGSSSWSVITSGLAPAHSADGVPAGSITLADPDSQWTYFSAPGIFLGDQSAAFGVSLQCDSRYVGAGTSYANEAEIVLIFFNSSHPVPCPHILRPGLPPLLFHRSYPGNTFHALLYFPEGRGM